MSQSFIVIGLDDSPAPQFAPEAMRAIGNARVFSGGTRHRAIVAPLLPPGSRWINIGAPVDQAFASYAEVDARQPIVVFASGDPLFYGFACTIRKRLPQADIRLYPAFNSLQLLAHRLLMPYGDMRIVSLTGRPWKEFDRALIEGACKIGVLTDLRHTPAAIARRMLDYGYSHYTMYVGERLGDTSAERVSRLTLDEAARSDFDRLCCLLLQADGQPAQPPFGIPDERFAHLPGRPGMITKRPIRLLALSALELPFRRVLWGHRVLHRLHIHRSPLAVPTPRHRSLRSAARVRGTDAAQRSSPRRTGHYRQDGRLYEDRPERTAPPRRRLHWRTRGTTARHGGPAGTPPGTGRVPGAQRRIGPECRLLRAKRTAGRAGGRPPDARVH